MTEYIHPIVKFAEAHAALVYVLAFFATCLESIAIVGLVVPGSAIIVALGALVPSGAVSFWWLCACSILGALTGDGLSYWIGHQHQAWLKRLWLFRRYPEGVAHGERFFGAPGGKSVFLSRFIAPVRGTVPLVAGMAGMAPGRFFAFCALSALGWAPTHVLPGALIGAGLTLTDAIATRLLVIIVALAGILWLVAKGTSLAIRHGRRWLAAWTQKVEAWARNRDSWLARRTIALLDPARGEARTLAILGLALIVAAWTFFGVLEDVISGDPLVRADAAIYQMLQGLRSSAVDRFMIAVTELGSSVVAGALAIAVLLFTLWRRAWHSAAYWVAAVGGAAVIGFVIKAALHRPRPTQLFAGWDAFSFPSGHATTNTAIYGFLAVFLALSAKPARQALVAAMAALVVALIGFSRLYLGAHWFSDVVGGIAFGTAWIALLAIAYVRHDPPRLPGLLLAAIVAVTVASAGAFQVARKMPSDLERYAVRQTVRTITAADWWRDGWREAPPRRIDVIGEYEEPLVLQWAGNLEALRIQLAGSGWRQASQWSALGAMGWLSPSDNPLTLPVLPRLHDGHTAALTLVRVDGNGARPDARWVLRVWKTGIRVAARGVPDQPLWVGAITRQPIRASLAPFDLGFEKRLDRIPLERLLLAIPTARMTERMVGRRSTLLILAYDPELAISP